MQIAIVLADASPWWALKPEGFEMRESTASFLRLWGVATFFVICGVAVGIHKMSDEQVLAVWGMGNSIIPLPAPTLKQQAETVALSHVSPKALVRVQELDGSIKFVPVAEEKAEAKAAEYRLHGLWAQVQYKEEK